MIKLLHWINVSSGHGVHNIIIYSIVSHKFQFPCCFQDITLSFHNKNLYTWIFYFPNHVKMLYP